MKSTLMNYYDGEVLQGGLCLRGILSYNISGGMLSRGILSGGVLSGGDFVQGDYVLDSS